MTIKIVAGTDEGEFPGLSKTREAELKKSEQNQIGGQGLSSCLKISEAPSNSNVAGSGRLPPTISINWIATEVRGDSSDGAFIETPNTKRFYETAERIDDFWK